MSDGAAAAVVMSAERARALGLKPLARFIAFATAGCLPEEMGVGPVYAIPKALKIAGLSLEQIDVIELNEAFAAQSLAVIKLAGLDPARVNVNGGAIALGHPLGCTGAKLTATILRELERRKARFGMVTSGSTACTIVETRDVMFSAMGAGRAETVRVAVRSEKESRNAFLKLAAVGESVAPVVGRTEVPGSVNTKSGLLGSCVTAAGVWPCSVTLCDCAFAVSHDFSSLKRSAPPAATAIPSTIPATGTNTASSTPKTIATTSRPMGNHGYFCSSFRIQLGSFLGAAAAAV